LRARPRAPRAGCLRTIRRCREPAGPPPHGFAVVVQAHVERLDLLGLIGDEHRPPKVLFGEVALVFGLKVAAQNTGIQRPCALVLRISTASV
jgi:hypothetical protein